MGGAWNSNKGQELCASWNLHKGLLPSSGGCLGKSNTGRVSVQTDESESRIQPEWSSERESSGRRAGK